MNPPRNRYTVKRLDGYQRGDRRWVVWDRQEEKWADDAWSTRTDALQVCAELNSVS